ncbi:uncharacterized protein RSE6_05948 [Rhynchosporium secalis]|uniref:Uncharacterized protein n=1 Tax=Rhynchosporium secalis TaxID=38038 RepID=A0A1E1M938_RHYSE|nr:uncharacterized protein RSE6_05948 [Rhynchosporium secalis]
MSNQPSSASPSPSTTHHTQKPTYTPSLYSTASSLSSSKALVNTQSSSRSPSKLKSKAKKFLSSLKDSPTVARERDQEAKTGNESEKQTQKRTSRDGKQAFGAVNHGPSGMSTFGGERALLL